MSARSLAAGPVRATARAYVAARTIGWRGRSRLFAVGERTGWSVDEDATHVEATARRLGYQVGPSRWARFATAQAVFLTSHFEALQPRWTDTSHLLATAYLHGRPGTRGYPEFDRAFETLRAAPQRFSRIQVTHAEMRDLVLEAGVRADDVHVIRIGIDLEHFPVATPERRRAARAALDLPADAFVIGSFQKDGVGWGEGLEPKLIKGPDVLVAAAERLHRDVPELQMLLTGPARGYVRRELERRGIPSRHAVPADRAELARAYQALDVYVVSSRQEGGPKGVLEAMASGVPLVTTRVGQAQEIAVDGVNALVVDVDDPEAIAHAVSRVHANAALRDAVTTAARSTADGHAYEQLDVAWGALFAGFLVRRG